jgi:hypothetical protein
MVHGGFKDEAMALCAFLSNCVPTGTLREFEKMTGADLEKVLDVGNEAMRARRVDV